MSDYIIDSVFENIQRGQKGLNIGLPHGFKRLSEYVPNIQQGTYFLVGAESSAGKTAFVDNCFVLNPYNYIKDNPDSKFKLKVFYYSLEIDKKMKLTKFVAHRLFTQYKLVCDVNYILSRGKNRVSDEIYQKVVEFRDYFAEMEDSIEILDANEHPTKILNRIQDYAKQNGVTNSENGKLKYVPNNPNEYVMIVVDHIGLVKKEQGFNEKQNIDHLSQYMINMRNWYNYIPIMISQFNRTISSTDRFKLEMVEPQPSDFKNSGNPFEDCNICFALFSPQRYNIQKDRFYNVGKLDRYYRSISLLKNRDGEPDKQLGAFFVGECGFFTELPPGKELEGKEQEFLNNYHKKYKKIV